MIVTAQAARRAPHRIRLTGSSAIKDFAIKSFHCTLPLAAGKRAIGLVCGFLDSCLVLHQLSHAIAKLFHKRRLVLLDHLDGVAQPFRHLVGRGAGNAACPSLRTCVAA
jgi:hypothetical protein